MKVTEHNGSMERQVLIGMVVSRKVLGPIATRWESVDFSSPWANLVGDWCVKHYKLYGRAPGRSVEQYFEKWAGNGRADRDTIKIVEKFLQELSAEYGRNGDGPAPDYILDEAQGCFARAGLEQLNASVEKHLEQGDVKKAVNIVNAFRPPEVSGPIIVNPLLDMEAARAAVESKHQVVIKYNQQAMDNFFETSLERDGFIGFMGKSKVGKSFWLLDVAMRAVKQGRNVYYIQAGDMSRDQVLRRVLSRLLGRPLRADSLVRFPSHIENSGHGVEVTYEEISYKKSVEWAEAKKALAGVNKKWDGKKFRLSVHSNRSVTIQEIKQRLIEFKDRDKWVADVVVIDYMDILCPMDRRWETRDAINENWMQARSISQELHCLVVGGTQSDTDSFSQEVLKRDNFTGARQVLDHVTGMVGINQTAKEKEQQVYRLNWIVSRDSTFPDTTCVYCAGCLAVAKPCTLSTF